MGTIIVIAFVGTFISVIITSVMVFLFYHIFQFTDHMLSLKESCAFGALISATDPVAVIAIFKQLNADLFALVFGESMLNDAVSIVMY